MAKQLRQRAKDVRRQKHRRGTAVVIGVGGAVAAFFVGRWLYRKIFVDAPPKPGTTKDWSGCWAPPDWVSPKPAFECGTVVYNTSLQEGGKITDRTWSGSPDGGGIWVYGIYDSSTAAHEEGDLSVA